MEKQRGVAKELLNSIEKDRRNIIQILRNLQNKQGYLSWEALLEVSNYLELPPAEIYGLVTYYKLFRTRPVGYFPITVCLGTACYLAGGRLVLEAFERELNIKEGEITEDKMFSLDSAACFGCCTRAPVVNIKGKIYPNLTPARVEEAIINLKNEFKEE